MKKILIPTDFSAIAYNAVEFAMNVYQKEDCTIYLLNAVYDTENIIHGSIYDLYLKRSETELDKMETMMKIKFPNTKIKFKKVATAELLNTAIQYTVEAENIDLIVMGTNGIDGIEEILFGSNTVSAMNRVGCPLLAIPKNSKFKEPENIVLATDYKIDFEEYPLGSVINMVEKYNAELHVIHIREDQVGLNAEQTENRWDLEDKLKGFKVVFEEVVGSGVEKALFKYNEEKPIDLLVMIKSKHTFFQKLFTGSKINSIGSHIKFPFLVLPQEILETQS